MLDFTVNTDATTIDLVSSKNVDTWLEEQSETTKLWLERAKFRGRANEFVTLPDSEGKPGPIIAGIGKSASIESIGLLPKRLPVGDYQLKNPPSENLDEVCLGWGLGAYDYNAEMGYSKPRKIRLHVSDDVAHVQDEIDAVNMARTLITKPANLMLPPDLEQAVREVGDEYDANIDVTTGDALIEAGFNTIYAVGKASVAEPRLLDLTWGDEKARRITILGKGVCFDSGGLDLKSQAGMRSMKKDMGGAATALGLAKLIMARNLPIRLRLLIPTVENAVNGNAYRPGDVIKTYKGSRVEIGNTDAEGRLILCDALALAAEESPELMIDFATLTGAARSAVGSDISAMFATSDEDAAKLVEAGEATRDPITRLPLHEGYRSFLNSPVADLCNIASASGGGAITAALFLQHFVDSVPWIHYDIGAWNDRQLPARPRGGEAMGLRATFRFLEERVRNAG